MSLAHFILTLILTFRTGYGLPSPNALPSEAGIMNGVSSLYNLGTSALSSVGSGLSSLNTYNPLPSVVNGASCAINAGTSALSSVGSGLSSLSTYNPIPRAVVNGASSAANIGTIALSSVGSGLSSLNTYNPLPSVVNGASSAINAGTGVLSSVGSGLSYAASSVASSATTAVGSLPAILPKSPPVEPIKTGLLASFKKSVKNYVSATNQLALSLDGNEGMLDRIKALSDLSTKTHLLTLPIKALVHGRRIVKGIYDTVAGGFRKFKAKLGLNRSKKS